MCVPCLRIALVTSMASAPTWDKVNARTAAFRCAGMPILGLDDSECWKYVVYILECAGNCYYVGIECRDKLAKRLSQGPAPPPPSRKPPRASSRSSSRSSRATEQPSNLNRTRVAHLFSAHIFLFSDWTLRIDVHSPVLIAILKFAIVVVCVFAY